MADPLLSLRQALAQEPPSISYHLADGTPVDQLQGSTHIQLAGLIFPRDQSTRYRSRRGTGAPYALDAVCFLLASHRDSSFNEYMQEAKAAGVGTVGVVDKKDLIALVCEQPGQELQSEYLDLSETLPAPRTAWQEALGDKLLTAKRAVSFSAPESSSLPSALVSQVTPQSLPAGCVPVRSRQTAHHAEGKDWTPFVGLVRDTLFATATAAKEKEKERASTSTAAPVSLLEQLSRAASQPKPSTPKNVTAPLAEPIIILPAAPTALLTLHNAREFLERGQFRPSAEAARLASGPKEPSLTIEHGKRRYRLIDNPTRLSLEEWNRVVAVVAHGPAWQFKGWKWATPLEIFQHVCGFHLHYEDTPPETTVASWNVHCLAISRSRRHLDAQIVHAFWQRLEQFLHCRQ